jgi:hypothetical protein
MDGDTFLQQLRDEFETELSRLGSSKALYAVTGGEMDGPSIRAAAAAEATTAAATFPDWAQTESDEDAADLFADVAAAAEDHQPKIGSEDGVLDAPDRNMYDTLAGFDTSPERVGGLIARQLVSGALVSQMVGFFVGNADPNTANDFRSIGDDFDEFRERALEVLETVCEDDDEWDDARTAAAATIESAYDYYIETLESMGVEPKNVC